jgi:hypothetical protein
MNIMTDKEKTAEILKRISAMKNGYSNDDFVKIKEFRLGSGYGGFSQQRIDCFAISPNAGNKSISYEIKVSRADFRNDLKKADKQVPARCFSNEFYYCTPIGLLKREEIPVWAGLLEFDLSKPAIYDSYYPDVRVTIIKPAPSFDKCQPNWGMVISAYRNGYMKASREFNESIISE